MFKKSFSKTFKLSWVVSLPSDRALAPTEFSVELLLRNAIVWHARDIAVHLSWALRITVLILGKFRASGPPCQGPCPAMQRMWRRFRRHLRME